MRKGSNFGAVLRGICSAAAVALPILLWGSPDAEALPRPASGSNCNSDWVNNQEAMQCFIDGQEDIRKGVKHPRYVACLANGEVLCCRDNDAGGQNCEGTESRRPPLDADKIRALLDAQLSVLDQLRDISERLDALDSEIRRLDKKGAP